MLDIKYIRENPKVVRDNIKRKYQDHKLPLVDELLKLDEDWRKAKQEADKLRGKRNQLTLEITKLAKAKKDTSKLIKEAKELPTKLKNLEEKEEKQSKRIKKILYQIPNIMHKSVPKGKDDTKNVEIKKIGAAKVPKYTIENHAKTIEKLCGADFISARNTSGNGFYYLEGGIAELHSALLTYAKDFIIKKGFTYIVPPFMIRKKVVEGVMSFEEMDDMMYKIEGEDLYLIGTSEHSLIGKFIGNTVNKLPVTYTSYSPCFRKEKGAHGLEEKGLFRVHQFEKQEMIVICEPKDSYKWYDKMLGYTVELFKSLKIPIRTLEICSGDLADLKAKSADVEAWSPRQKKYFEVGSCSNLTDAQARRLQIRANIKGEKYFPHTLNNTVLASPRALVALIENYQQKDGSIKIPEVLVKYMGGKKVIK